LLSSNSFHLHTHTHTHTPCTQAMLSASIDIHDNTNVYEVKVYTQQIHCGINGTNS
jgi:hypothetical protein